MGMTKKYWKGVDELKETPAFLESKEQEFSGSASIEEFLSDENLNESSTSRRDFLKFLGFSVAAATVAACEAPVTKIIPYVNKPENVTPGQATWYASTFYDGVSYASILVKTREGRPIYIKGNKDFGVTKGAVNPQIVASVLGLYDSERLSNPQMKGKDVSISSIDKNIKSALKSSNKVVLLSSTIISPSMTTAINDLKMSLGEDRFEHIQYDAVSYSAMREANAISFNKVDEIGMGIIPNYDFSKAKTIVSIGADFLNSWLFPTKFVGEYGSRRKPEGEWMSKHFQFESVMSITGSNADYRGMIKPSEEAKVLAYMIEKLGGNTGGVSTQLNDKAKKVADKAIKALKASKGESIVVAGSNNLGTQILANKINSLLSNYGKTIDFSNPILLNQGNDKKVKQFVNDIISGSGPDTVIFYNTNPVYTLPNGDQFGKALSKVKTTIAISAYADETASKCKYIVPNHHALEDWSDYEPIKGHYAIAQPTIRPLHNTFSALESLLVWVGKAKREGKDSKVTYKYIKDLWIQYGYPNQTEYTSEEKYWNMMVHNSCTDVKYPTVEELSETIFSDSALSKVNTSLPKEGKTEVVLYQKASMRTGVYANNPWLQEMPDPLTKATWDNYITMNPVEMAGKYATTFDEKNGLNKATIKVGNVSLTLPVYPLPGQAIGTVGVALGYGRGAGDEKIGKAAYQTGEYGGHLTDASGKRLTIGENAFRLSSFDALGNISYNNVASVEKTDGIHPIACTQIHHTVMGRHSVVRETTLDIFKTKGKEAYNPPHVLQKIDENGHHVAVPVKEVDLWDKHPVEHIGHRWGMAIDLSSCIGCGSCLIACQAENNVPVVGKNEVRKGREMHWLRIDRYFASNEEAAIGTKKDKDNFDYDKAELAAENPSVVHMPMMCHHCNHAPCETVCPVAATNHSDEGLNQMAYNRCIGTRYCANNCPYKVRRFNWFNYPSYKAQTEINPAQDDLGRMVLNPDVTVRTRGVMEKCSFCVQRIQESKLNAKKEGRPVQDGEFTTACSDSCPTDAITVGDWNDVNSKIRKTSEGNRAYQALEEIGIQPNIWYQVKVRNEENEALEKLQKEEEAHGHALHDSHENNHGEHH